VSDAPTPGPRRGPDQPDGPAAAFEAAAAPVPAPAAEPPAGAPQADEALDAAAEAVESDIATLAAQRDEYLALAQRLKAEFDNYKKQAIKRNTEIVESAASRLAEKLLPVLDACDAALTHGHDDVKPVYDALMDVLEKEGLGLVYPAGEVFDPNLHDAVMHEPADDGAEPTVAEVLRSGYTWKGRVLRPAMVKVKG
jgi:molecular chaperone GrpE